MLTGERPLIAFAGLSLFFGIIFALAYLQSAYSQSKAPSRQPMPQLYQGIPLDAHLIALDKAALEQAYHQHLIKLWNVWLTDGAREAHRITNGLAIARESYHAAAQQIERREQELRDREQKK